MKNRKCDIISNNELICTSSSKPLLQVSLVKTIAIKQRLDPGFRPKGAKPGRQIEIPSSLDLGSHISSTSSVASTLNKDGFQPHLKVAPLPNRLTYSSDPRSFHTRYPFSPESQSPNLILDPYIQQASTAEPQFSPYMPGGAGLSASPYVYNALMAPPDSSYVGSTLSTPPSRNNKSDEDMMTAESVFGDEASLLSVTEGTEVTLEDQSSVTDSQSEDSESESGSDSVFEDSCPTTFQPSKKLTETQVAVHSYMMAR